MPKTWKMRGWMPVLALFLGVGVMGAMRDSHAGGDVVWLRGYEQGLAQAQQTGKPLLLSFHSPGCGWCQKLDAETYTDPKVVALSQRFTCVRLDSEADAGTVQRLRVFEFPTTMFADPQGHELARFASYAPPDRFARVLEVVLKETDAKRP